MTLAVIPQPGYRHGNPSLHDGASRTSARRLYMESDLSRPKYDGGRRRASHRYRHYGPAGAPRCEWRHSHRRQKAWFAVLPVPVRCASMLQHGNFLDATVRPGCLCRIPDGQQMHVLNGRNPSIPRGNSLNLNCPIFCRRRPKSLSRSQRLQELRCRSIRCRTVWCPPIPWRRPENSRPSHA
jgi:hypothetical protein